MPIDLRHLRYFVAVCESGQITAAARSLHMAQPALTQSLQALEREVGVHLLDRHPKGVTPTIAGARFYRDARATLASFESTLARAREELPASRTLRLGSVTGSADIDRAVLRFRRELPDIAIAWRALGFHEEVMAVVDGEIDVSFFYPDYRVPAEVRVESLARVAVHLVIDTSSPLAARNVVRFEDFEDRPWTGQHPSVPEEFADTFYLTAVRGHRPRTGRRTPLTYADAWTGLASGEVIGIVPGGSRPSVAPELLAQPRVIDVPPFTLRMAYREDNGSAALAAFVASVHAGLALAA